MDHVKLNEVQGPPKPCPLPSWQIFNSSSCKEREVKVKTHFTMATENAEGIGTQLLVIRKIHL